MTNRLKAIFSIFSIFLWGCTALPRHPHSEIALPKSTRSGLKIVKNSVDFSQVKWWNKMHDPTLNYLIKEALLRNNQIQTAKATILQAQAKLKEAHFAWLPTLGGKANGLIGGGWDSHFSPQGTLAQSRLLNKTGNFHFRAYDGGFVPSYSLNILQNISINNYAKASLEVQRAAYQSTRLSIMSQVAGSYFMLLGKKEQLLEQSQLIHDLEKIRQLELVRFRDGANDLTTVTNLEHQLATNQANLKSIEDSISEVENAIQLLLNRNPGPIVTPRSIRSLSVEGLIPTNLPAAVLKNRPDLIMAEQNLKMSESNIGIAYANFFPNISLTGLLGGASVDLSHLLKISTGLWIAQAAASLPILNGSLFEQIQASKASYDASYYAYVQTLKTIFADVDNSLTHQQMVNEMYNNQLKALHASQKAYNLALARYRAGAKDDREVVNAQLDVDYANLDANLAKMQQLDSIVEVYQALAGGYKAGEPLC